jgi:hypothetical protein
MARPWCGRRRRRLALAGGSRGRHLFGFGSGRRSGLGSGAGASTFADKVLDEALVLTNVFLANAEASELFEERLPCGIDVLGAEAVLCGEAHVGDVLEAGWSTDHGLVDLSAGGCLLLFGRGGGGGL